MKSVEVHDNEKLQLRKRPNPIESDWNWAHHHPHGSFVASLNLSVFGDCHPVGRVHPGRDHDPVNDSRLPATRDRHRGHVHIRVHSMFLDGDLHRMADEEGIGFVVVVVVAKLE